MIPNKNSSNRQVVNNLDGETFDMSLDASNFNFIMGILTDLYKDRILAIIREYATNARDSHIVTGIDQPIEITLPTRANPVLSIKDFGEGLDKAGIREVYTQYAASTKRDTNDLNGVLGIGCKSALAYADQFTVIGRKDGIKTTVAITRPDEGGGKVTIVSEEDIPEYSTGVEVMIPADPDDDFEGRARELFRFWDEGTVLIDDEEPEKLRGGVQITENIVAYPRYGGDLKQSYVVMGNVPYPIDERMTGGDAVLVIRAENGSIDFPPNRESLQDTPRTRAALKSYRQEYQKNAPIAYQKIVNEAKSKPEALDLYQAYRWLRTPNEEICFKGEKIPLYFGGLTKVQIDEVDGKPKYVDHQMRKLSRPGAYNGNPGRGRQAAGKSSFDYIADRAGIGEARGLWITGYTNTNWNGLNRERFEAFLSSLKSEGKLPSSAEASGTIVTEATEIYNGDWLDPNLIFDWGDIKRFKIPNANGGKSAPKAPATYTVWTKANGNDLIEADEIDTDAPICFSDPDGYYYDLVDEYLPGVQIAELSPNRVKKFQRLFPDARQVSEVLQEAAQKWATNLTEAERKTIAYDDSAPFDLDLLPNPDAVVDPELRELITLNEGSVKLDTRLQRFLPYKDSEKLTESRISFDHLGERYPLLDEISCFRVDKEVQNHIIIYVNTVYAQYVQTKSQEKK